jgi:hypothetical protein
MEIQVAGSPAHTRSVIVTLGQAEPGHLAVHGEILDLRKRGLVPLAGDLQTAGVIHHMRIDGRIARQGPTLETLRADQPHVAFEAGPGTGGECCRDPVRRIEALEGTRLDDAYAKRLGAAIGGPRGCSHVLTLAQLLGSAVVTALETDAALHGAAPQRPDGQRLFARSLSIDGLESADGALALALQLAVAERLDRVQRARAPRGEIAEHDADQRRKAEGEQHDSRFEEKRQLHARRRGARRRRPRGPRTTPMTPPSSDSTTASTRNCVST